LPASFLSKFKTVGAYPFACSISPCPILIFILAFARLYIGGVTALDPTLDSAPAALEEAEEFVYLPIYEAF